MGCDIHIIAEVKENGKWNKVTGEHFTLDQFDKERMKKEKGAEPFDWRSYSMFGFLADVRNYSCCPPISQKKGLPEDSEWLNSVSPYAYKTNPMSGEPIPIHQQETVKSDLFEGGNYHSFSWITLRELIEFDYDKTFEDRRYTKQTGTNSYSGGETCEVGQGEMKTFREHLGEFFFIHLNELKSLGEPDNVRIVFWFDN